jgi:hypothetical protein
MILVTSYFYSQDAFAYSDSSIKEQNQFKMSLFLAGFVGIYGMAIYMQKKNQTRKNEYLANYN